MSMNRACYGFVWVVLLCATAAIFTAAATNHWVELGPTTNSGMFQKCTDGRCDFIKFREPAKFEAARLLMIGCLGFLVLATLLSVVSAFIEKDVSFYFTVLLFISFATCLTSLIVYTIYYYNQNSNVKWAWSYIVAWTGCGLHGVGLIILLWAGCCGKDEK